MLVVELDDVWFAYMSRSNICTEELFMLMHFLDARKFGSLEEFQEEFKHTNKEEKTSRLHKMLAPHDHIFLEAVGSARMKTRLECHLVQAGSQLFSEREK